MIPENFAEIMSVKRLAPKAAAFEFGVHPDTLYRRARKLGVPFKTLRRTAILRAISIGIDNSRDLSAMFRMRNSSVTVTLHCLENRGLIVRVGRIITKKGPPFIRWRAVGPV